MENESKADRRYDILKSVVSVNPFVDNDGTGGEYCIYCIKEHNSCNVQRRLGKTLHGLHEEDCIWMRAWTEVNKGK
jgi:hypothetical protein